MTDLTQAQKRSILIRLRGIETSYVEILQIAEIKAIRAELNRVRAQIRELEI